MKILPIRYVTAILVSAALAVPLSPEMTDAAGCVTCIQRIGCHKTDVICSGCDPWGSGTCTGTDINYNPANGVIKNYEDGGGDMLVDQGDVICFTQQQCSDAYSVSFSMCSGKGGIACTGVPTLLFCYVCTKVGTPFDYIVRDYECNPGCG